MPKQIHFVRLFALAIACVLAFYCLTPARGDIPRPPKPAPDPSTPDAVNAGPELRISTDGNAQVAHLRIPRSVLQSLAPQGQPHSDSGISPARTVVAGLALASALAISGLFLVRGRGGRGRTAIMVAVIGTLGVATTLALADIPPINPNSPRYRPHPPVPVADAVTVQVVVEIGGVDGPIELTLPADQAAKLAPLPTTRPVNALRR